METEREDDRPRDAITRLVLARHAETELNAAGRFRGHADPQLTSHGERQAQALGRAMTSLAAAAVYCSPRQRAVTTSNAVSAPLGLQPIIHQALDDFDYGDWTGKTHAEAQQGWPTLYGLWLRSPEAVQFPNGESVRQIASRISGFLALLRREYAGQTVVAVTHDAVIRLAICAVLGSGLSPYHRIAIDLVSTTGIDIAETPRLLWTNGAPHLADAAAG